LSFPVESIAIVPHLKHLFYLDRKQAGGSSLLFLIDIPLFVHWRAMQHTQAVLSNKVHAVPCIWIILCHLMEIFLQQTNIHRLSTLYPPQAAVNLMMPPFRAMHKHISRQAGISAIGHSLTWQPVNGSSKTPAQAGVVH
jgi:hypothetical protein